MATSAAVSLQQPPTSLGTAQSLGNKEVVFAGA